MRAGTAGGWAVRVGLAIGALCSGQAWAGGPGQPPAPDAITRTLQQRMDAAGIVGLGAAIIRDRKVVWTGGVGFADRARAARRSRPTPS
ncbi:hypothetical protein ACDI35_21180 [Xanthomonas axonopodis pv. cajani]|uniref:hypothetical protein n=1 Tax=Xanthomonas axonopodis TaxID=53413 RepID=UPI003555F926